MIIEGTYNFFGISLAVGISELVKIKYMIFTPALITTTPNLFLPIMKRVIFIDFLVFISINIPSRLEKALQPSHSTKSHLC